MCARIGYNSILRRPELKRALPALRTTVLAVGLLTVAAAQRATPEQKGSIEGGENYATMHMRSNLGSFKIIPATDDRGNPDAGRLEFSFTGTVLISKLDGKATVSDGLRKEFDDMDRVVYHGTGSIVIEGKWRAVQWFGGDMEAVWYGRGIARVVGEFDRNLETGELWFDDPVATIPWMTQIREIHLPERKFGSNVRPRERGSGDGSD